MVSFNGVVTLIPIMFSPFSNLKNNFDTTHVLLGFLVELGDIRNYKCLKDFFPVLNLMF